MDAGTGARTEGKGDTLSRTHGGVALSNSRRDLVICRERCLENIKRDMKTHTHTEREREREREGEGGRTVWRRIEDSSSQREWLEERLRFINHCSPD